MNDEEFKKLVQQLRSISQDIVAGHEATIIANAINHIYDQREQMARAIELINNPERSLPWEGDAKAVLRRALGGKSS